jgi:hypothetical protein
MKKTVCAAALSAFILLWSCSNRSHDKNGSEDYRGPETSTYGYDTVASPVNSSGDGSSPGNDSTNKKGKDTTRFTSKPTAN